MGVTFGGSINFGLHMQYILVSISLYLYAGVYYTGYTGVYILMSISWCLYTDVHANRQPKLLRHAT